jgi:polysaccharide deacetylase family protein (PEP-CTERM system associated)
VASHGYDHLLCREKSIEDLKNDFSKSKKLIEDITGRPVNGYRAPGFSISRNILSLVEEAGYLYDSSINSFKLNKRYGQIELKPNHGNSILHKISESFYEIPISNVRIGGKVVPWGGGGYFRLFPLKLFKQGVQSILKKQGAYLFYMHPWEIDPEQPHVKEAPFFYRLRHYVNMKSTFSKLSLFIEKFRNCKFQTCHQYLLDNRTTH